MDLIFRVKIDDWSTRELIKKRKLKENNWFHRNVCDSADGER